MSREIHLQRHPELPKLLREWIQGFKVPNLVLLNMRSLNLLYALPVRHLIAWNIARVNLRATRTLGFSPSKVRSGNIPALIFAGSIQAKTLIGATKGPPYSSFGYLLKRVINHGDHKIRSMTISMMNPTINRRWTRRWN